MKKILDTQRERYDREAYDHAIHNNDRYTQEYRDSFIRRGLFSEDLKGKKILDAMSASGVETSFLIGRGADVVGLDISSNNAEEYKRRWGRDCYVQSVHDMDISDASFDAVYICGGLHHVLPMLPDVMKEIYRILKPGGIFYFVEPNKSTWVNKLRNIWYQFDSRFGDDEEAIDYQALLLPFLEIGFEEKYYKEGGGIAYLVVAQSLSLGIPMWFKKIIAKPLFTAERIMSVFPFSPKLFFSASWVKK